MPQIRVAIAREGADPGHCETNAGLRARANVGMDAKLSEGVRVLVEGYFEEVIMRLDDPGLEDLVRRRISEKLAEAEDQVKEFIGERAEAG